MSIPPPPPYGSDQPGGFGQQPPYGQPAPPPGFPQYGQPQYAQQVPPGYQAYGQGYGSAPVTYAGFWSRFGALLIDGIIGAIFGIPAYVAWFAAPTRLRACTINDRAGLCEVPTGSGWAMIIGASVVFGIAYLVVFCRMVGKGQSWGMKAVGNKVVSAETGQPIGTGRAVGRFFAHYVSGLVCYLGYLWMLWDSKKQTWHDKIVGTVAIKA